MKSLKAKEVDKYCGKNKMLQLTQLISGHSNINAPDFFFITPLNKITGWIQEFLLYFSTLCVVILFITDIYLINLGYQNTDFMSKISESPVLWDQMLVFFSFFFSISKSCLSLHYFCSWYSLHLSLQSYSCSCLLTSWSSSYHPLN